MRALAVVRRALRRLGRRAVLESGITTLAFLVGLAMVAGGCALVYLPAGLIVGGLQLTAGSMLYARGRRASVHEVRRAA